MTRPELRSVVFEVLKERFCGQHAQMSSPLKWQHLFNKVGTIAHDRGLKTFDNHHNAWSIDRDVFTVHPNLKAPIWEIIWDLLLERVLCPGTGKDDGHELPYVYATDYGKSILSSAYSPYDPDGYLKNLQARVPKLDQVIFDYLAESSETLRRNCLLSSTITMGAASEKMMLLLLEKTEAVCGPGSKPTFLNAMKKAQGIKKQNEAYNKWFTDNLRQRLLDDNQDRDWVTDIEQSLGFLFNHLRTVRNSAGHPSGVAISREVAASHLTIFPRYLEVVYRLLDWLDAKGATVLA